MISLFDAVAAACGFSLWWRTIQELVWFLITKGVQLVISPTSFTPKGPVFDLAIGDLGIGCPTVKTPTWEDVTEEILGDVCDQELVIDPLGRLTLP